MSIASCAAQSPPIFRCRRRPNSKRPSTSRKRLIGEQSRLTDRARPCDLAIKATSAPVTNRLLNNCQRYSSAIAFCLVAHDGRGSLQRWIAQIHPCWCRWSSGHVAWIVMQRSRLFSPGCFWFGFLLLATLESGNPSRPCCFCSSVSYVGERSHAMFVPLYCAVCFEKGSREKNSGRYTSLASMTWLFCQQSKPTLVEAERNTYKLLRKYARRSIGRGCVARLPGLVARRSRSNAVERRRIGSGAPSV
jgi:hypothetical protein